MTELNRDRIIEVANEIRLEYRKLGLTLTIREMYDQFVSRGLLESSLQSYKRIVGALTTARFDGRYPLDGIEDRGREVTDGEYTTFSIEPRDVIGSAASYVRSVPEWLIPMARWAGQLTHVSVWVEKEALAGVFERPCSKTGVSLFACKGYPSVSALWDWLRKTAPAVVSPGRPRVWTDKNAPYLRHEATAERAVVLYYGDHDPDGWEIPRSAERNVRALMDLTGLTFELEFYRIALNMDQIEEHDPPPFEAKVSSSRCAGYVREHGTDQAWELDALDPKTLQDLIFDNVEAFFDEGISEARETQVADAVDELKELMGREAWVRQALGLDDEADVDRSTIDPDDDEE